MKARFEILYTNKSMKDVSNFMDKIDLGFGMLAQKETYEIKWSNEKTSVEKVKELIKEAFEALDCEVHEIKGGLWE